MQIVHVLQDWWQHQTWQEITGALTGLACVYLAAKNYVLNWPIAIVSTALYIYVCARAHFYADMFQYVYLCATSIYGWYNWSNHPKSEDKTPIVSITRRDVGYLILFVAIFTPLVGFLLITFSQKLNYHPPAYPYLDSFCTACSFAAQIMLTRKILQNWLIWIFVDIIYTVIYFEKGFEVTSAMFFILIIIAVVGYIDWRKDLKTQRPLTQ